MRASRSNSATRVPVRLPADTQDGRRADGFLGNGIERKPFVLGGGCGQLCGQIARQTGGVPGIAPAEPRGLLAGAEEPFQPVIAHP